MAALFSTGSRWLRKSLFTNILQYSVQTHVYIYGSMNVFGNTLREESVCENIQMRESVWEYMDGEDCVEIYGGGKCV
jgi:hypothetical protein